MKNQMRIFSFTVDMDWAPYEVIKYAIDIFDEYSVRCTLFLTNVVKGIDLSRHELALHSNFNDLKSLEETIIKLFGVAPGAIGIRSHSLFYTARLLPLYAKHGIRYDSNVVMYNMPQIFAYRIGPSLWELPIFFMDNIHLWMNTDTKTSFGLTSLKLDTDGLKIFAFHPIHIFLNTETMARYEAAKPYYKDVTKLKEYMNPESSGVGTRVLLKRLLALVNEKERPAQTLSEITNLVENSMM